MSFSKTQRSTASPAPFMGASEGLEFCPDVFGAFSFMNNARVRPSKPCGFRRSCRVHVSNQRTNSAFLSRCGFWLVKLCRSRRCQSPADRFRGKRGVYASTEKRSLLVNNYRAGPKCSVSIESYASMRNPQVGKNICTSMF